MTFWETVERGEYVMIALALIFIAIVCIWWIRTSTLRKATGNYPSLMQRVRDHVAEGDIENARRVCDSTQSCGAKVIAAGLDKVGFPLPEVKAEMKDMEETQSRTISKGTLWLRAFAVISPLLGLGGTLTGIIDRLSFLATSQDKIDTAIVCAELAPALVTSVVGLGVGIFALIALTCLESTIVGTRIKLDRLTGAFSDLLNEPS